MFQSTFLPDKSYSHIVRQALRSSSPHPPPPPFIQRKVPLRSFQEKNPV
jgi:hypothetical protein